MSEYSILNSEMSENVKQNDKRKTEIGRKWRKDEDNDARAVRFRYGSITINPNHNLSIHSFEGLICDVW